MKTALPALVVSYWYVAGITRLWSYHFNAKEKPCIESLDCLADFWSAIPEMFLFGFPLLGEDDMK